MRPLAALLSLAALALAQDFRPPAVPLVVHDPYFSIWSPADRLTDAATVHWTGRRHALTCLIRIDGKVFRLMGNEPKDVPPLEQLGPPLVSGTQTQYEFRNEQVAVLLTFLTPALPDMELLARPVSYLSWELRSRDRAAHVVAVYLDVSPELCVDSPDQDVTWDRVTGKGVAAVRAGSKSQEVLGRRGDDLRIDWGHVLLAAPEAKAGELAIAPADTARGAFTAGKRPSGDIAGAPLPARQAPYLVWTHDLGTLDSSHSAKALALLGYDDQWSILYMDQRLRPYWRRGGMDTIQLLEHAVAENEAISRRCAEFETLWWFAASGLGREHARIAQLAWRQCLGANKLCADQKGQPLLFPKENFSNGCISTVDVIYPMAPLFLATSIDLSKAMLVPVLDYAMSPRWKFPFAPHDLGTYPHATGQVYGGGETGIENQMPVEESANLILLVAALARREKQADFAARYWPVLHTWARYLKEHGLDPENQLCTDDFTGHLAHNVNLSAKAILALGAYAQLCEARKRTDEAREFRALAEQFAAEWVKRADDGDHTRLAFDKPGTWSQKYNLVWDRVLDLKLFPEALKARELAFYKTRQNQYGLPLDSRADFTKIDWTHWTASITGKREDFEALVLPMYRYLHETPDRVPICDWHDTKTARKINMIARPVVGGVFMEFLAQGEGLPGTAGTAKDWAPFPVVVYGKPFGTSETEAQTWEFTATAPAGEWFKPGFDSSTWQRGPGGFGSKGTPGAVVRTEWTSPDLWLRREVTLSADLAGLALRVHHDEDAEIWLNGILAADPRGYTTSYQHVAIRPEAKAALKPGPNLLAVHCRQTTGGQYVDVGFARRPPRSVLPVARGGGWLDQHLEINRIAATQKIEVVFFGDSITQGFGGEGRSTGGPGVAAWKQHFADKRVANFGISGDSTQHLLWRIEHGNFQGIAPRTVMLMIGTNNLSAGHTPAEVAEGVAAILRELRVRIPAVKVLLLGVFPRGQKPDDPMRARVADLNTRLLAQADGKLVVFKDLASVFLDGDGTARAELYARDYLHLSAAGYEAWATAAEKDL